MMTRRWRALALLLAGLCLLFLSTCSELPSLEKRQPVAKVVQLEGAHGPLSIAHSKAIIGGLQARGGSDNQLARHLAVEERIVDSPLTTGNQVDLLQDGPQTYKAMLSAIAEAREHINMETYIFDDDEVGRQFAAALIAAHQRGVRVSLIRDSVGTLGTPNAFFQRLTSSGIAIVQFNPVNPLHAKAGWQVNQRDHRKLLIIDGRTAFLGGINISNVYSGSSLRLRHKARTAKPLPWRDTDLKLQGPVVAELQQLFLHTWAAQGGRPLPAADYLPTSEHVGNAVVRAIGSSPDDPYSQIYVTLIAALRSAQSEVWISNAYFVPDPQLLAALQQAAGRGVDVRLLLPSSTDSWLVLHAGRAHYSELLQAGVKIYERRNALLHVKTAVIDGVWSTVGSTNLDWRSFLHNQEVNAVVLGADFGDKMRAAFVADQAQATLITLASWQQRPWRMRIKEQFGHLWEYWL